MPDGQKHYYGVVIRKLLYNYRITDDNILLFNGLHKCTDLLLIIIITYY